MVSMALACFITLFVLFFLKPLAERIGLVDIPGGRKLHQHHTPLVGGIGVFLGALSLFLIYPDSFFHFSRLYLIAGFLLIVGVLDDLYDLKPNLRLSVHLSAGVMMIYWGNNVLLSLGDLFFMGDIILGFLAVPFTLFCVASAINAVNMTDGVDGLLGGLMVITLALMGYLSYSANLMHEFNLIGILICCLLGFLVLNFRIPGRKRAVVFMGDAGSTVLGFITAWLLIDMAHKNACPPTIMLWLIAHPLLDCAYVMYKRRSEGRGVFQAGRDHLHHLLLDFGLSVRQTVLIICSWSLVLGGIGVLSWEIKLPDGFVFFSFMALLLSYLKLIPMLARALQSKAKLIKHSEF